jgi:integration host factor subunit alpha
MSADNTPQNPQSDESLDSPACLSGKEAGCAENPVLPSIGAACTDGCMSTESQEMQSLQAGLQTLQSDTDEAGQVVEEITAEAEGLPATLTRFHLVEEIHRRLGLSRPESASLLEQVLDTIVEELCKGHPVQIRLFGGFSIIQKPHRIGRNPKTRVEAPIFSRKVLTFRPSQALRARINGVLA